MSTLSKSSSAPSPAGRTTVFVAAAAACLGITAAFDYASRPAAIEEFGRIGEEFYPNFTDPTLASGLAVHVFDKEEVIPRDFKVARLPNGRWTIPSHHGYPADAEDQLGKTAASVIGIKRGAMVTRWPADHAQYGVVNPKQESLKVDEVEGVGKRLILNGAGDEVLADYIIGNSAGTEHSNEYYVRSPNEDEVYIASLTIDLSTKFSDWIDTDMLHISQSDLVGLTINDYAFEETQRGIAVTTTKTNVLKREESSDPWTLDDLNEETEEVDKEAMTAAANAIADMKIVGVREKQPGLTPELKLDRDAIKSQGDVERMQTDLMSKGFLLQPEETPESLKLIAREGELFASTSDGLTYRMYFGRAFTGTQEELEIGLTADSSGDEDATKEDEEESKESDESSESDSEKTDESKPSQPGRYVFVRVDFSEENLGERPAEPVAPVEPEELKQEANTKEDSGDSETESADKEGDAEDASDDEPEAADSEKEDDPLAKIREEYESAKKKYDVDVLAWESEVKEFEKKIKDGQEKADKLNRRFADWYYVIPGETFDKLRLSRDDLVKPKEKEEEEKEESAGTTTSESSDKPEPTPEPAKKDAAAAESGPTEDTEQKEDPAKTEETPEEPVSEETTEESPAEPAEPTESPEPTPAE